MDVTSERSVSNYLDNGAMCQLEHEQESIMQLTLENYPEVWFLLQRFIELQLNLP